MSAGIFPRIERGQLLAGGLLSGPSAASDARYGGVSPYPGVYSRCIPVWDRPQAHRPGRVCQKERNPTAAVCDAVLVFMAARALRPRVRSSHALLLVQWRLVAIWVSRVHVSARKPSFPWRSRMSRSPPDALSIWGLQGCPAAGALGSAV